MGVRIHAHVCRTCAARMARAQSTNARLSRTQTNKRAVEAAHTGLGTIAAACLLHVRSLHVVLARTVEAVHVGLERRAYVVLNASALRDPAMRKTAAAAARFPRSCARTDERTHDHARKQLPPLTARTHARTAHLHSAFQRYRVSSTRGERTSDSASRHSLSKRQTCRGLPRTAVSAG